MIPKEMVSIPFEAQDSGAKLAFLLYKFLKFKGSFVPYQRGFHFINLATFQGNRVVQQPGSKFHGTPHLEVENLALHKLTTKSFTDKKEKDETFNVIKSEYKIHIMAKPEYILAVVELLIRTFNNEPELAAHIHQFKVKAFPLKFDQTTLSTPKSQTLPQIVVYPSLGKDSGNVLLARFYRLFEDYDTSQIGLGFPPRFNACYTALLSASQGGGDLKLAMTSSQQEELLTASQTHYSYDVSAVESPRLSNPAVPDLKLLASALERLAVLNIFTVTSTSLSDGDKKCELPHVRLWSNFKKDPKDPKDPNKLHRDDDLILLEFNDTVIKPMGLDPISFGVEEGKFYVRVCLPGFVKIVRDPEFSNKMLFYAVNHYGKEYENFSNSEGDDTYSEAETNTAEHKETHEDVEMTSSSSSSSKSIAKQPFQTHNLPRGDEKKRKEELNLNVDNHNVSNNHQGVQNLKKSQQVSGRKRKASEVFVGEQENEMAASNQSISLPQFTVHLATRNKSKLNKKSMVSHNTSPKLKPGS